MGSPFDKVRPKHCPGCGRPFELNYNPAVCNLPTSWCALYGHRSFDLYTDELGAVHRTFVTEWSARCGWCEYYGTITVDTDEVLKKP